MKRSVLVLGLGETGSAVARHALNAGDEVTVYAGARDALTEAAAVPLLEAGVEVRFDDEDVKGSYDLCVASPGIPQTSPFYQSAKRASTELVSEPEYAWRQSPEDWVAVTGTNGKTTTTALIAHLLLEAGGRVKLCGNTQDTTTLQAVENREEGDIIVAELSSYQLASTSHFAPRVGVLLNITPDHLSWHGSEQAYADAKLRLFHSMESGQVAIVCEEVPGSGELVRALRRRGVRTVRVGREVGVDCAYLERGELVVRDIDGNPIRLVKRDELAIKGAHNASNALAASVAALVLGATPEAVRAGLRSFEPLAHRIERVGEAEGVVFYDDSKATNVDATVKALTAFPHQKVVLLVGGRDKGTDLSALVAAARGRCSAVIAYGEAGPRFFEAFEATRIPHELADGLAGAFERARAVAQRGEAVLLSPACASFDEFSGFAERGDAFKRLVGEAQEGELG